MGRRVFIVEDDADLRELYADALALYGHEVLGSAADGAEAVAKLEALSRAPEVIIMDYRLPRKNGVEVAREIRRHDPEAFFLFISADGSCEAEARALGGPFRFKKKPFGIDRLIANVELAGPR
jgi:two-component system chemotaxis response regulator CheY